ncbi:TIR domain-containing protein [Leisingera caerulea]|uniref:TIR domain-containing protein n=1 Tax=Leisingera caerulea TaxID=506591 RepID=UPI001376F08E|nr:nucleotide-binding protein [Leisingera caerulea]
MKPRIFIGSSREGAKLADAIHFNLTYDAECTVWKDGVFQLSSHTLTALITALRSADFGIFVFSPDDVTVMRGETHNTVRDNVLFELGMFIGRLGPERCFFLVPDDCSGLRLPSDLAGVTPGRYESRRSDNNWQAALNPACMQIRSQVASLKSFQDAVSTDASPTNQNGCSTAAHESEIEQVSAQYYKRSILVKGLPRVENVKIKPIGSWNNSLAGWVVPRSREKKLLEIFPSLEILPADVD